MDTNIQGAGAPEGSPAIAIAAKREPEICRSRKPLISPRGLSAVVMSAKPGWTPKGAPEVVTLFAPSSPSLNFERMSGKVCHDGTEGVNIGHEPRQTIAL